MGLDKTDQGYQEEGIANLLKDIRDGLRGGINRLDDDGDDRSDRPDRPDRPNDNMMIMMMMMMMMIMKIMMIMIKFQNIKKLRVLY